MEPKSALKQAYKDLSVEHGYFPLSFKLVAEKAGLESTEFIKHYPGLAELAQDIWVDYLHDTLTAMEASPEMAEYGARERMLGFYFTFFEVIGSEKDFVKLFEPKLGVWNYSPGFLEAFKRLWIKFVEELVEEGTRNGELVERMMLSTEYAGWHWPQFMYLLNQWVKDDTEGAQQTDKAVEKSVNLGFDLMSRNVLDSAFDFMKFIVAGK